MTHVSDFYYELPEELIAQEPPARRGESRMLVVSRDSQTFRDDLFANFYRLIRADDCLVLNDTRVIPARLRGSKAATTGNAEGARVEVLLIRALNDAETEWRALVRPGKRVRVGDRIVFAPGAAAEVVSQGEFGERVLRFESQKPMGELLEQIGSTPLPPYIKRRPELSDRARYQTVFAAKGGSVAAPTAGLHFTEDMLERCRRAGADIAHVTLHVGLGTFAPLRGSTLEDVTLHEEYFEIGPEQAAKLARAKRLVCVGTTSVRTIETALLRGGFNAIRGETNLFIHPGFHFRGAGALLTNFHLPESSLLMLVCAFAGQDLTLAAYRHAVREKYRFFSYGDCMLIE